MSVILERGGGLCCVYLPLLFGGVRTRMIGVAAQCYWAGGACLAHEVRDEDSSSSFTFYAVLSSKSSKSLHASSASACPLGTSNKQSQLPRHPCRASNLPFTVPGWCMIAAACVHGTKQRLYGIAYVRSSGLTSWKSPSLVFKPCMLCMAVSSAIRDDARRAYNKHVRCLATAVCSQMQRVGHAAVSET